MEITVKDLYDFKACPLRFKFTHIDKVSKQNTVNDHSRDTLQTVLNHYYSELLKGVQPSLTELKEMFSVLWNEATGGVDLYSTDVRTKRKKEIECISMLNVFYSQQKIEPDYVLATNLKFRVPFGDDFFVKGSIPVVRSSERGTELLIHKFGNSKYDEFWQKTDMGLTLMAMAYHSMYKTKIDNIAIHILKDGTYRHVQRDRADYKRLNKTVKFVQTCIKKDWLYPRETNACNSCPAKKICMEWK